MKAHGNMEFTMAHPGEPLKKGITDMMSMDLPEATEEEFINAVKLTDSQNDPIAEMLKNELLSQISVVIKHNIWSSTSASSDDAKTLAAFYNNVLSKEDRVEIVAITPKWFMIIGNDIAKERVETLNAELHKQNEKTT